MAQPTQGPATKAQHDAYEWMRARAREQQAEMAREQRAKWAAAKRRQRLRLSRRRPDALTTTPARTARPRQSSGATLTRTSGGRRTPSGSRGASADPGVDGGEPDPPPPPRGPMPRPRFSRPWRHVDGHLAKRRATLDRIGGQQ